MRCLWAGACVLALLVPGPAASGLRAAQDLPTGRLVTSVVSRANPAQRYTVYLPSSYKARTPRPVLFIMDYRGRARVAAEVFRPAAERYGWILVSSNHTSSDQAPGPTLEALRAMWTDAHDLWTVDTRRLYLAGLSGTARTATLIASQLKGEIAGVIGAAAGLSPGLSPKDLAHTNYFGTAGDEDYNYWEMRSLERQAAAIDLHARVEYFAGPHRWMPPDLATAAIEWLDLKAMQRGLTAVSPAVVERLWKRDERAVQMFIDRDQPQAASRRYAAMARDFEGLRPPADIAALKAESAILARQPRSKAEVDAEERSRAAHIDRLARAMRTIAAAYPPGAQGPVMPVADTLEELEVRQLLEQAAGRRGETPLAARRVLAELSVQTGFYLPVEAMAEGEDDRARYYLYLAEKIDPVDAFQWFLRAKIAAKHNLTAEALASLRTAVDRGFRTLDALENDNAFANLRSHRDFASLLERIRAGWQAERRRGPEWPEGRE